jgi:hypothetical protein
LALVAGARTVSTDGDYARWSAPAPTGPIPVDHIAGDEPGRVHAAFGANYDRLLAIKRRYDPTNLFRLNHNISPAD